MKALDELESGVYRDDYFSFLKAGLAEGKLAANHPSVRRALCRLVHLAKHRWSSCIVIQASSLHGFKSGHFNNSIH